jgi:hypothetical protein
VEHLEGHLQLIARHADDIGVHRFVEDDRIALHGSFECTDVIAQSRCPLVVLGGRRLLHLQGQAALEVARTAAEEAAEILGNTAMGLRGDASHARSRALTDVGQKTGPP